MNRPTSTHDLIEAAYRGLPDADPKLRMSAAIRTIRAAIFDLRESDRPELRLGANELDIRWRLAAKRQGQPLPVDFQAALDHLDADGDVSAAETSRGTVYALTPKGRLREEDSRVPAWRRLAADVSVRRSVCRSRTYRRSPNASGYADLAAFL